MATIRPQDRTRKRPIPDLRESTGRAPKVGANRSKRLACRDFVPFQRLPCVGPSAPGSKPNPVHEPSGVELEPEEVTAALVGLLGSILVKATLGA
jgi:hypothetical protein